MKRSVVLLFVLGMVLLAGARVLDGERARAAGPCGTANDGIIAKEQQLFDLVNSWRGSNLGQPPMQMSHPANKAAQWLAEEIAAGRAWGHDDQYGRVWWQRLIDCGFSNVMVSSGEGLAAFAGSNAAAGANPQAALQQMTSDPNHQNGVNTAIPWKCAGVGYSPNAGGVWAHVWVVVVATPPQNGPCPEPLGGQATPTPTQPPPTAAPSPTPSPPPPYGVTLEQGWNLVMLPAGPIEEVMERFAGCFASVYEWRPAEGRWLRFAPGAPAYVNTLAATDGQGVWVHGLMHCTG
jgi:hypothetical protein